MAGVIKTHTPTTSKVSARGKTCLFACYATDHARDCFVMMDPQTKSITHSRDVLWLNRMYFQSRESPGASVMVKELSMPVEEGSVVSDSDESISSAGKKKDGKKKEKIGNLSDSDLSNSNSMDLYNLNESYRSTDMDYTQTDGTQLDPYQQGPLEHEHEILFHLDSEDSDNGPGTTRSGTQYTLSGIELAALNVEENYTNETCKLGETEARVTELQFFGIKQWSKRNSS